MKHRLSLCFRHARFCSVFARASSRFGAISGENPDFSLFFSLATDLRLLSSRSSGDTNHDKPGQRSPRNRPTHKPGRRTENARGGRRHGRTIGARPSDIKTGKGWRLPISCKMRTKGSFMRCYATVKSGAQGGVREVDRGAVEDIERRGLLFV